MTLGEPRLSSPPILLLGLLLAPPVAYQTPPAPPPLYAVRLTKGPAWDEAKSPNDQAGMREHSANVARMRREGVLVIGDRFGELGLLVLRVPDESAVQTQLAPDPAIAAGIFKMQVDAYSPFAHGTTAWLTTPEAGVLRAYADAFNRHEAEATIALCAENLKWYSLQGDNFELVEGREHLRDWLKSHFASYPTAKAEFMRIEQSGPFITVRERGSWDDRAGKRESLQSIGVYEIRDGLIQRVWYYPSVKDASAGK